jgi:hypothetical protein
MPMQLAFETLLQHRLSSYAPEVPPSRFMLPEGPGHVVYATVHLSHCMLSQSFARGTRFCLAQIDPPISNNRYSLCVSHTARLRFNLCVIVHEFRAKVSTQKRPASSAYGPYPPVAHITEEEWHITWI